MSNRQIAINLSLIFYSLIQSIFVIGVSISLLGLTFFITYVELIIVEMPYFESLTLGK